MDNVSPEVRSRMMASIRQRDTKPEMIVRRLVHSMGYRYRLHVRGLPGSPDLVFPKSRRVVFVHGCYWHRHRCRKATTPSSNVEFWQEKFEQNRTRDRKAVRALRGRGWEVLVVWECQTKRLDWLGDKLGRFLA